MKISSIVSDAAAPGQDVIGEVEIRINGMVINAVFDADRPLIEAVLGLIVADREAYKSAVSALAKLDQIAADKARLFAVRAGEVPA